MVNVDKRKNYTLLESLVSKTHLNWYTATVVFALLLIFGLLLTALTEKTPINELGWDYWRVGLQGPAIIIYILIIYPILNRMGDNAIESIIPLLDIDKKEFDELQSKYYSPKRLGEWISLSAGAIFILVLSQPWKGNFEFNTLFLFIIEIIMFSLLALLIYYGFNNTRYITQINKNLKLDIFNVESLAPIARWSLSVSLAFIGGIMISIIFQNADNLMQWQVIIIYVILVASTVVIFFVSLWSTHMAIVNVKRRELAVIEVRFAEACHKLTQKATDNINESDSVLHLEVTAWGLYERRIRETREWPYNAGIIGRLLLSILSPGIVYLIKLLTGIPLDF
jgi:hypothetical protein